MATVFGLKSKHRLFFAFGIQGSLPTSLKEPSFNN